MNKKEIQKNYDKKIKLINDYDKYYYNESSPLVSDKEYDEIKQDIFLLEKKINSLILKNHLPKL